MPGINSDIFIRSAPKNCSIDLEASPIPLRQGDPIVFKTPSEKQGASLRLSRTLVSFGDVPIYTTSTQWVTFTNNGSRTLQINNIMTSDYTFAPFQPRLTIPPGESRSLKIDFTPMFQQSYSGYISFDSNDPEYSSGYIYVSGRGT